MPSGAQKNGEGSSPEGTGPPRSNKGLTGGLTHPCSRSGGGSTARSARFEALIWGFVVRPLGFEPRTCGLRDRQERSVRCSRVPDVHVFRIVVQEIRTIRCGAQEFCSSYCSKKSAEIDRAR